MPEVPLPVRRALLATVLVLAGLLAAELVAWALLAVAPGSLAEIRQERRRLAGLAEGGGEAAGGGGGPGTAALLAELQPADGEVPAEVLHPFLGFVFNPDLNAAENRRAEGRLEIDELGFFRRPGPPPEPDPDAVRVGVFGGSVAFLLAFEGRERLTRDLEAAFAPVPALAGRPVEVKAYALGGHKQPQQLAALAWLLARGHRFDLVLNLDGFNEVTLPAAENLPQRTALDYPRGWRRRVGGVADLQVLRRAGAALLLREERRDWARAASAAPWRWSPTAHLVWRARDRRLAMRLEALELAAPGDAGRGGYQARGPFDAPAGPEALYRRLAALWASSSLQMHHLCAANGIAYHHFLQPNQYVPGSKPLSAEERARAFDPDHPYRRPAELGYPELRRAGRELAAAGVAFHDLSDLFADVQEPLYVDACCHVNRRGSELLATAMAAAVRRSLELPGGMSGDGTDFPPTRERRAGNAGTPRPAGSAG